MILPESVILPDTLSEWPWKRRMNPHYLQVKAEASAWIRSLVTFTPGLQRTFDLSDFGESFLLAAREFVQIILVLELLASLIFPLEKKGTLNPLLLILIESNIWGMKTSFVRVAISCICSGYMRNTPTLQHLMKLNKWPQWLWMPYAILTRPGQPASTSLQRLPASTLGT